MPVLQTDRPRGIIPFRDANKPYLKASLGPPKTKCKFIIQKLSKNFTHLFVVLS